MESNSPRGLFGVSSARPVEQRVAPPPTEPTENENENVCFEIPSVSWNCHGRCPSVRT